MDDWGTDARTWRAEWQQTAACDRVWILDGQNLLVGYYEARTGDVVCCRPGLGDHLDAFVRGWYAATVTAAPAWPVALPTSDAAAPSVEFPELAAFPDPGPIPATIGGWHSGRPQPVYGVSASAQAPLQVSDAASEDAARLGRRPGPVSAGDPSVAAYIERMFSTGAVPPRGQRP